MHQHALARARARSARRAKAAWEGPLPNLGRISLVASVLVVALVSAGAAGAAAARAATAAPTVSGMPYVGTELIVSPPSTVLDPVYSYAWQRCDPTGVSCSAIPEAKTATYVPTMDDRGYRLRALVAVLGVTTPAVSSAPTD